jgi:TldD protein
MAPPAPFDHLSGRDVDRVLDAALERGAGFAEIFVERRETIRLRREEAALRSPAASVEAGAGIRVLSGDGTGYAHTTDPSVEALLAAAGAAGWIAARGVGPEAGGGVVPGGPGARPPDALPGGVEPADFGARAAHLEAVDRIARAADPRIREVVVALCEERRAFFLANTAGRRAFEVQVLTTLTAAVYLRAGGRTHRGHAGAGSRRVFAEEAAGPLRPEVVAGEAARRALVQADAVEAPAGAMPVVIGGGWGGVLLHEAIGHGFEADFVRRGTSAYAGRLGARIASGRCTVVDDGTIPGLRGSFEVDDEGTPARRTLLVDGGVLAGYLHDLLSAGVLGAEPTGNGRRQSFRSPPIPRQSNLLLLPGEDDPADILASVPRGLYARGLGGGMVDIVNGNFVFEVTEGYLIEEGRPTAPVRGANLIGSGLEVLANVARVGADFEFDPGIGVCGKEGQGAPVGVGQPTVLVSSLTVGGTRL